MFRTTQLSAYMVSDKFIKETVIFIFNQIVKRIPERINTFFQEVREVFVKER